MKDGKRASKFSLRDRSKKDRALILYNFELKIYKTKLDYEKIVRVMIRYHIPTYMCLSILNEYIYILIIKIYKSQVGLSLSEILCGISLMQDGGDIQAGLDHFVM